ncbi:hypothetical protein CPB84DRAFT_1710041 [Gymnopilus junonius]|uniref:Uncharacterized protein n=1 Tax=Gymnopilus junonius TaxID=109634 RepID=A0A9P5NJ40_GYMJU|nr:hypothetical protein CPB84DRAFT_1710041 [Gymnopilus junonius]
MDSSFPASPRRTYDIPKPETGLAEWTSKIKALQREVDADEEAEQKRLEEEIAAAREARLRRSRGMGRGSRVDSLDMTFHNDKLSALNNANDTSSNDTPKSMTERETDRETSLRKLMERNDVYNPDKISGSIPATSQKSQPVPLAAFIGGRATGPRLNKHAPQQDAHDPTQFVQPDVSAPHPVFGRGGIAMPGLASKKDTKASSSVVGSESSERYYPSSVKASSSIANSYLEKIDQASKKDSPDPHRHSYTGMPKSLPSVAVEKPNQKAENLMNRTATSPVRVGFPKPNPISASRSLSFPTKNDKILTPDSSPQHFKGSDNLQSKQDISSPSPKATLSDSLSWPTREVTIGSIPPLKSADSSGSRQNALSSTPKSMPLQSYLPKKEESSDRNSSSLPKSSADIFQSNSSTSNKLPSYLGINKTTSPGAGTTSTSDTPLRRIMERNNVYNPDKITAEEPRKSVAERAQSVSLAAFIGGSGKGPRLNRHAPQQDAHDPTQFIQPDVSAPHPIFGRGGVAMPGMMARRNTTPAEEVRDCEISERYRPPLSTKPTWPPASNKVVEKADEVPVSPKKTGNRERTTSAPDSQVPNVSASQSSGAFSSNRLAGRQSPSKESHNVASLRDRTISGPVYPQSSFQQSSRSSVSTPSLARPIQSIPKSSSLSPQIPITASPAFQKPPPPKELTPSISRLQGRGFVQNMVKASAHFESPPSPISSPEKSRPHSASAKKGSVLDRWQPGARSSSPTKSTSSSYASGMKRSSTQDSTSNLEAKFLLDASSSNGVHVIKSTISMPSLTKASSTTDHVPEEQPRTPEPYQRSRTPGLGSATTMVLIKPSLPHILHVDELGVKHDAGEGSRSDVTRFVAPAEITPSSKKSLIHPTKDRARKARKYNEAQSQSRRAVSPLAHSSRASLKEDIETDPSDQGTQTTSHTGPASLDKVGNNDNEQPSGVEVLNINMSTANNLGQPDPRGELTPSPALEPPADFIISKLDPSLASPPLRTSPLPSSPMKHVRIPSTGKRPTVMELAQTLMDPQNSEPPIGDTNRSADQHSPFVESSAPKPRTDLLQIQAEKRKSNYERYSALILPPLKEESPSPAGTLARSSNLVGAVTTESEHDPIVEDPEENNPVKQQFEVIPHVDLTHNLLNHGIFSKQRGCCVPTNMKHR